MRAWAVKDTVAKKFDDPRVFFDEKHGAEDRANFLNDYESSPGRYKAVPVEITELDTNGERHG